MHKTTDSAVLSDAAGKRMHAPSSPSLFIAAPQRGGSKRSALIVVLMLVAEFSSLVFIDQLLYPNSTRFTLVLKPWIHMIALTACWAVLRVLGDQATVSAGHWLLNVAVWFTPFAFHEWFHVPCEIEGYVLSFILILASAAGWFLTDRARFVAPAYVGLFIIAWELTRLFIPKCVHWGWQRFWLINTPLLMAVLAVDFSHLRKNRLVNDAVFWLGLAGFTFVFFHQCDVAFSLWGPRATLTDVAFTFASHLAFLLIGTHRQRRLWTRLASVFLVPTGWRFLELIPWANTAPLILAIACFGGAIVLLRNKPQA